MSVRRPGGARDQPRTRDAPLAVGLHRSRSREPDRPGEHRRDAHHPVFPPAADRSRHARGQPLLRAIGPARTARGSRQLSIHPGSTTVADLDALPRDDDAHVVPDPASFRDPAGFVYRRDGVLLRQIDRSFGERWDLFVESGLPARLEADGRLIHHEPAGIELAADPARAHAVIRPTEVAFVSYPAEWSFGMLRDAALLTLDVQAEAMAAGLTLRDASAFNVLFDGPRPVLIDHLSFEPATPGNPWPAYRQFCEHFLAPLALMARRDVRLGSLLRSHLDGIPLDLAARLLPWRSRFSPGLGAHIHA